MNITLAGHHLDITDGIREAVDSRFKKLASHFTDLSDVDVTLTVERNVQKAEATTKYLGTTVAVQSEGKDMYSVIGETSRKLEAALSHRKGVIKSVRPEKN